MRRKLVPFLAVAGLAGLVWWGAFQGPEAPPELRSGGEPEVSLLVVDAGTGEPIEAVVLAFRAARREDYSVHEAPAGAVALGHDPAEEWCFSIGARGHVRRRLRASELAAQEGPQRVPLEPGYSERLRVVGGEEERPLAEAVVLEGETALGTTDADGWVEIALPHWPAELRVRAVGYAEETFEPEEWLHVLEDPRVWLAEVEPGAKER